MWMKLLLFWIVSVTVVAAQSKVEVLQDAKDKAVVRAERYEIRFSFSSTGFMEIHSISHGKTEVVGSFPLEGKIASDTSTLLLRDHKFSLSSGAPSLSVQYADGDAVRRCELVFYPEYFTYQLSASAGDNFKNSVRYFHSQADDDATHGRFDEMRSWTPDLYDTLIPAQGSSRLTIGGPTPDADKSYLRGLGAGSPLVAPYVVAIRSGENWWGIGTPEVPSAEHGLDISIRRDALYAAFDGATLAEKEQHFPRVGIYFGATPDEILTTYRAMLPAAQTTQPVAKYAAWWSGPIYCSWGDQAYQSRMEEGTLEESSGPHYSSAKYIDKFLKIADDKKLPFKTIVIDLGWADSYGDFLPSSKRFPDMRGYIDSLHKRGLHVILWMPLYEATGNLFNPDRVTSHLAEEHPDWIVKDKAGQSLDRFDYTRPEVREYIRRSVHRMLGNGQHELNADGLKLDFMDRIPEASTTAFAHPEWGTGEQMNLQVLQLIAQAAKETKPDAMIDSSFMNPFFQPWQDVIRLNDDVSNATDTYWWRAWAASQSGVHLIEGDDWWAMQRYFVPLTLAKAAWGIPTLYALQYRAELGTAGPITGIGGIASGGYPSPISPEDYARVRSLLDVYEHAPADGSQLPVIDPVHHLAKRLYTSGPMWGSPAAMTLNQGTALVTYTETSAWLTSADAGSVIVALPLGQVIESVSSVGFDGQREKVQFTAISKGVMFDAKDAAQGVDHYEIIYNKGQ